MPEFFLPPDPVDRFIKLYEALNEKRGFFGDANSLRFTAMSAVTCPGAPRDIAQRCRSIADEIKQESGWFGSLSSPLRFIVSALLLLNGDTAKGFIQEIDRVNTVFRKHNLRRGGIYETMAILILRLQHELKPIPDSSVSRFQDIYEEMKHYHWWLTGPDDFPACAILVGRDESVKSIGLRIENIYQALSKKGFSTGDPLQTAANLMYLANGRPEALADRYAKLAREFKSSGVSIWQSDYDELAILSFLDHQPTRVVEYTLKNRERMEQLRPDPGRLLTFNLAAGLAFLELVQIDSNLRTITDAKALMDMQAIINAQQAAAAAAATSAAVAATASSN